MLVQGISLMQLNQMQAGLHHLIVRGLYVEVQDTDQFLVDSLCEKAAEVRHVTFLTGEDDRRPPLLIHHFHQRFGHLFVVAIDVILLSSSLR